VNYVLVGYGITVGGLALYSLRVVLRGRALRRVLTPAPPAGRVPTPGSDR